MDLLKAPVEETLSTPLHELSLADAARAIKTGSVSASNYAAALLDRARKHADLKAFITLDEEAVLEAARTADLERKSGKALGPLHGVPIAIKDSFNTHDLPTSMGTRVLAGFRPQQDAAVVKAMRDAGAIVFGKNNLVEMSYGLTGLNAHHGQVKNPYDLRRIPGGSSSGGGACVAARIVPAALGGDTVGSIRVPASLCGVVGFRPSTGRWPGQGIAPVSHTLDTAGPMARTVEDCALLDAIATGAKPVEKTFNAGLKGLRFAYAPRQFLALVDPEVDACFVRTLVALKEAGADIVEIDLGEDFGLLALKANWPVFFSETMPHVIEFLAEHRVGMSFDQVYEGLGANIKTVWTQNVVLGSANFVSRETYQAAMQVHRPALQRRFADAFRVHRLDGLLFPTTPTVAPLADEQSQFTIAGNVVERTALARNAYPSSCAGLPGISVPIGLSSAGLPIGMEIDGAQGTDAALLEVAARVFATLGAIAGPAL
jgi:Asp-tRNA(Asn)/Glu-tRNA(Gln) amidotransferase A subunit family amidase